jgi:hypothetical protein
MSLSARPSSSSFESWFGSGKSRAEARSLRLDGAGSSDVPFHPRLRDGCEVDEIDGINEGDEDDEGALKACEVVLMSQRWQKQGGRWNYSSIGPTSYVGRIPNLLLK